MSVRQPDGSSALAIDRDGWKARAEAAERKLAAGEAQCAALQTDLAGSGQIIADVCEQRHTNWLRAEQAEARAAAIKGEVDEALALTGHQDAGVKWLALDYQKVTELLEKTVAKAKAEREARQALQTALRRISDQLRTAALLCQHVDARIMDRQLLLDLVKQLDAALHASEAN